MRSRKPITSFAPHEIRRFTLPLTLASVFILVGLVIESMLSRTTPGFYLIVYGVTGILYLAFANLIILRATSIQGIYGWINSILSGIGLGILVLILPDNLCSIAQILIILGALATTTFSGRYQAYFMLIGMTAVSLPGKLGGITSTQSFLGYFLPIIVSIIVMETIVRIKDTTQQNIHRLETINKVSRQIMQSLDTEQTISLLNATMQDALEADTYFIGIVKDEEIHLDLFYDDGEYFNGVCVPFTGTLSGWVIKNQRELFLPDLREDVHLEGVKKFVIGKEKTSLSWIGVPLRAENVSGVMA